MSKQYDVMVELPDGEVRFFFRQITGRASYRYKLRPWLYVTLFGSVHEAHGERLFIVETDKLAESMVMVRPDGTMYRAIAIDDVATVTPS